MPDGTYLVIDFDKKVVSTVNPQTKTFYQLSIDDFLSFGEKLPSSPGHLSEKTSITFNPTVGQEDRTILDHPATPYDLNLEADITHQAATGRGGGGGGFGGRRRGGGGGYGGGSSGGSFPGDPGTQSSSQIASTGCKINGEAWLISSALGDCDPAKLSIAESCAVLRGAPGLKGLADRIRKTKLTVVGFSYAVSIFDSLGQPPATVPTISAMVSAVDPGRFEASLFTIPGDYTKVPAPAFPLGTTN
jgi:hypothetical protein